MLSSVFDPSLIYNETSINQTPITFQNQTLLTVLLYQLKDIWKIYLEIGKSDLFYIPKDSV